MVISKEKILFCQKLPRCLALVHCKSVKAFSLSRRLYRTSYSRLIGTDFQHFTLNGFYLQHLKFHCYNFWKKIRIGKYRFSLLFILAGGRTVRMAEAHLPLSTVPTTRRRKTTGGINDFFIYI